MTTRNLAVRLAVIDGGKVKAELRDVGESGQRSLKRIEDAARPASRALQALDGAAGQVRGSLEGLTSRLGPLGGALSRLGPAGLVAGAGVAGLGLILTRGVQEAAEADRSYRRLEAVLRATGHASGLTAREIAGFAEEMERSTLASAESVQDAAAVLATFRSVSGETFTRAIRLAQDLSTVFGQDLAATATQLGKALEEPVQGISALRRVGVSFTASQRELIESLVETGQTAEAQKVILDALEQQVGGASAAEAGGLTGAANRLSDAWGNLLKAIGRTPAVSGLAEGALNVLSRAVEGITSLFEEDPISVRIVETNRRLIEARNELARIEAGGPGTPLIGQRFFIEEQRRRVESLQRDLDALIGQARREADAFAEEQRRAEAGRRAAEAERLAELLSTQRREIDRALDQIATDPAERIARVNRELDETRRRLDALRAPDGSNASDVDAAVARAEELARRRIEAIERPAREAAGRVAAANARVIEDLGRQLAGLADERQAFIDQALSRLSEGATAAQRSQVERLAGALYDEKQAREELAKAMQEEERLREEGRRLVEQLRTPTEEYGVAVERLSTLLNAGAIDQGTFNRALVKANEDLAAAQDRLLRQSREWQDGVTRALRDYVDAATDSAKAAEQATTLAFKTMEDALVSFVTTGKFEFASFAESILADITRIAVRQAILAPLADWLAGGSGGGGDFLGGLGQVFAGIFHGGGVVGRDAAPARGVDAAVFLTAPRYHTGGVAGLAPDEMPAILRRGEAVLTAEQMAALGAGARRRDERQPPVTVVMNISTPDVGGFRYAQGQIAADAARAIDRARRNL
ncbi:phage tail tape measure C-terminal domain-containing protein [Elioraea sp.]|uniref:phage tail tape measure C-terminal domain-containing protein n=1 Tax=Elioraea sp. TaxID=2185103 RepID=UPI00307D55AA